MYASSQHVLPPAETAISAQAINAAIHQQLDPYRVRYQAEMQKAGFTTTV